MNRPEQMHRDMPPSAPLSMLAQDLSHAPVTRTHSMPQQKSLGWRLAVFGPALIGTAVLL